MSCRFQKALSRGFPSATPRLREHLLVCAACAAEWKQLGLLREIGRSLPTPALDHARAEEVRTAVLARAATGPPARPRLGRRVAAVGALCAAAAALWLVVGSLRSPARQDHGTTRAHGAARFVAVSSTPDEVVRLIEGTISVEVTPLAPGQRFRIVTDDGEVEVRGTAFDVTATAGHLERVEVDHGRVEVRTHGSETVLHAGESWSAPTVATTPTAAPTPPPAPASSTPASSTPGPATTPPTPATPPSENPRAVATPALPALARDAVPASAKTAPGATPPIAPGPHGITRDRSSAPSARAPRAPGSTQPSSAAVTGAHPPGPVNPPAPPTPPASPRRPSEVAFADGWRALQGGDAGSAAVAFERAARLAPSDPLAEDAWFLHALALARAGDPGALAALETFLATYPRGARAGEAAAMAGWLLVDAGQLDRAERHFQAALHDQSPAVRDSARTGLEAVKSRQP